MKIHKRHEQEKNLSLELNRNIEIHYYEEGQRVSRLTIVTGKKKHGRAKSL